MGVCTLLILILIHDFPWLPITKFSTQQQGRIRAQHLSPPSTTINFLPLVLGATQVSGDGKAINTSVSSRSRKEEVIPAGSLNSKGVKRRGELGALPQNLPFHDLFFSFSIGPWFSYTRTGEWAGLETNGNSS